MMAEYSKKSIIDEYNQAAENKLEFEKVKWGSQEKMLNRFFQIIKELDFEAVNSWLDIGSGTGAFQAIVNTSFPKLRCIGIDISKGLTDFASSRSDIDFSKTHFVNTDFLDFKSEKFDLITCVGVLQKTNFEIDDFFSKTYDLLNPGGRFLLDTKNIEWEAFLQDGFEPEKSHRWFFSNDLVNSASSSGFKNIQVKGFIPGENSIVEPNKSHTIFVTGKK
jgi:cyclopropane fatty-acyl-phospholipid synthase-like methyltransferase